MDFGSYEPNLEKQNGSQTIFASKANIGSGFCFNPTEFCIVMPLAHYSIMCLVSFLVLTVSVQ
jgi:hypothetical protein